MSAAFERDAPQARPGRESLGDLRLAAAQPMLKDDRKPVAMVGDLKRGVIAKQRGQARHHTSPFRKRATLGASSAERPCVTSGPSKPDAFSLATKSAKSTTP